MQCIKAGYFNHFLLLNNYRTISKRIAQTEQKVYLSTPATFFNAKSTPFEDLSEREKPVEKEQEEPKETT